jgi:hypothetical protein
MATKTRNASNHSLRLQLAAERVESALGVIRACTVAKADVQAQGKVVMIDKAGAITRDEKLCAKELPVFTDAKFLETLMAAAAKAGPRVKAREDHDDSIGARAGFFDAFKLTTDGRVVADMHLFLAYRNRSVVLETADKTPEEIGLSIDFLPEFEIQGDRALMRVKKLTAVDIVDEGAITPGGLFLSAGVDTDENKETASAEKEPNPKMPASLDDLMSAMSGLTKTVGDCMSAISKLAAPPAKPAGDDGDGDSDAMKAVKAEQEKMASELKAQGERLALVTSDNAKLKKERALLGFKGTPEERAALEQKSVEDIEKMNASKKTFTQLVDERVATEKCKRSEAHQWAMKNHRDVYANHLKAKGIFDPNKSKAA